MLQVVSFTFNPFSENTYLLIDQASNQCIIFDPGCYNTAEQDQLVQFITTNKLQPVQLINTHCHIDHIFGNNFIANKYNLSLAIHQFEKIVLEAGPLVAQNYNIPYPNPSPVAEIYLKEGEHVTLGLHRLKILFTPGHSPGSISFYNAEHQFVIAGDVLFKDSVGRIDLPGGDGPTLLHSIKQQLLSLPDDTVVYPGHGPSTTIGYEKKNNLFLQPNFSF